MKRAKLKIIQATIILEIEGNPSPYRYKDLHVALSDVENKGLTLTNPQILPEYFAGVYQEILNRRQA